MKNNSSYSYITIIILSIPMILGISYGIYSLKSEQNLRIKYKEKGLMVQVKGKIKGKAQLYRATKRSNKTCAGVHYQDSKGKDYILNYCDSDLKPDKDYSGVEIELEYYVNDPNFVFVLEGEKFYFQTREGLKRIF